MACRATRIDLNPFWTIGTPDRQHSVDYKYAEETGYEFVAARRPVGQRTPIRLGLFIPVLVAKICDLGSGASRFQGLCRGIDGRAGAPASPAEFP